MWWPLTGSYPRMPYHRALLSDVATVRCQISDLGPCKFRQATNKEIKNGITSAHEFAVIMCSPFAAPARGGERRWRSPTPSVGKPSNGRQHRIWIGWAHRQSPLPIHTHSRARVDWWRSGFLNAILHSTTEVNDIVQIRCSCGAALERRWGSHGPVAFYGVIYLHVACSRTNIYRRLGASIAASKNTRSATLQAIFTHQLQGLATDVILPTYEKGFTDGPTKIVARSVQ